MATGFRGTVFLSDDNLVGNKVETMRLLSALGDWMEKHKHPFQFYCEASINLAASEPLMAAMVRAGIDAVFVGIETPSTEALRETQKAQNLAVDLHEAVDTLTRHGLDVSAGFIVGFDSDDASAIERQREWIATSRVPLAMVGILAALPGTQLERRLIQEGRLIERLGGDTFDRPNFRTKMDEVELLKSYARLLESVYAPAAYFERSNRSLELKPRTSTHFQFALEICPSRRAVVDVASRRDGTLSRRLLEIPGPRAVANAAPDRPCFFARRLGRTYDPLYRRGCPAALAPSHRTGPWRTQRRATSSGLELAQPGTACLARGARRREI